MAIIDIAIDMDTIEKMMQNDSIRYFTTDLHTHILPTVDDGASSMEMALNMLSLQKKRGVERVALTPHFYPNKESLEAFIKRRNKSYTSLKSSLITENIPQLSLGAEVRFAPKLVQLDLQQLTIGHSNFLLLELPDVGAVPLLTEVVDYLLNQGIIPVLAHVERCDLFRNEPEQLVSCIQMGALAQVSAVALTGRVDKFAVACLNNGLAHIIASDAHMPLDCDECKVSNKFLDIIRWTEGFARAIWDNTPLPAFSVTPIRKGLFGYK